MTPERKTSWANFKRALRAELSQYRPRLRPAALLAVLKIRLAAAGEAFTLALKKDKPAKRKWSIF